MLNHPTQETGISTLRTSRQGLLMPRDPINLSRQERTSTSNSFPPFENPPQHIYALLQDNKHQVDHSNQETFAASSDCCPSATRSCYDFVETVHPKSRSFGSSNHQSDPACDLCSSEYPVCPTPSERSQCYISPACLDPQCSKTICDTCSDHEECYDDCLEDCLLDCGFCIDCDGFDRRDLNNSSFAGFDTELFGDQTTETFGLGNCLPRLPMQKASVESNCFDLSSNDASVPAPTGRVPAPTGHVPPRNSLCSDDGHGDRPNPVLMSSFRTRTAADRTASICAPLSQDSFGGGQMTGNSLPTWPLLKAVSHRKSTDTAQDNGGPMVSTGNARPPGFDADVENPADKKSIAPSARCQWVDGNGQPCGHVVPLGDKLHEHLQTAHGVKSEVFCRWLGCRVGIFGASPHHYASNVQRHTWGHSGYRPFKCPTCLKSFAAAKVLEEHFTNFHLRRKAFDCSICAHQCTSAANLKRHKDEKHGAERFQCEFCNRNGRVKLFPRGSNLARHFRKCKYVLASFPDDNGAAMGKMDDEWFPPGYRGGNHGMDRAKITPPKYLPAPSGT
jgi:hypothetical protein